MTKSATFGVMHLGVTFGVSHVLSGRVAVAGAIMRVEPVVNTVAQCFFDRWWARREQHAVTARLSLVKSST